MDFSGVEYEAVFVPLSLSRNATAEHPCINWRITIRHNGHSISTDYMQGVGHLPFPAVGQGQTIDQQRQVKTAVETGKYREGGQVSSLLTLPAPKLEDVLYSLSMDSDAIEHPTYEGWAADLGFDEDSRKGERMYRKCLEIGLLLRKLFDLDELREHFQDY